MMLFVFKCKDAAFQGVISTFWRDQIKASMPGAFSSNLKKVDYGYEFIIINVQCVQTILVFIIVI